MLTILRGRQIECVERCSVSSQSAETILRQLEPRGGSRFSPFAVPAGERIQENNPSHHSNARDDSITHNGINTKNSTKPRLRRRRYIKGLSSSARANGDLPLPSHSGQLPVAAQCGYCWIIELKCRFLLLPIHSSHLPVPSQNGQSDIAHRELYRTLAKSAAVVQPRL